MGCYNLFLGNMANNVLMNMNIDVTIETKRGRFLPAPSLLLLTPFI